MLGAVLFAGCCGAARCDYQDERADALFFQFADTTAGSQGFRPADIDTIVIERYALRDTPRVNKPDTLRLIRTRTDAYSPLVIDNASPFGAQVGRKLSDYRYVLLLPGRRRPARRVERFTITSIQLDGKLEADGCCTYYRNTSKSFLLNGRQVDAYDPTNDDQRVTVKLQRP
ncbi:hypothetical protein GCM10023186_05000 [Hymenobacter koreensis]|uniref:Lipoprotein n=1 Tax=Hymenobacter koreensis TaxID=1084523 RepID=A0ABP8IVK0_9BACT